MFPQHKKLFLTLATLALQTGTPSAKQPENSEAPHKVVEQPGDSLLLRASFDTGIDADFAIGNPKGTSPQVPLFEEGVKGKALVVGGEVPGGLKKISLDHLQQKTHGGNVYFEADGNIDLKRGSVSYWVKPMDWDGSDPGFNVFTHLESPGNLFLLYKNLAAEQLSFYIKEGEGITQTTFAIPKWKKGQWHHVAFTWTEVETNLYINGRLVAIRKIKTPLQGTKSKQLSIGPGGSWQGAYIGRTLIDEVEIYRDALTHDKIIAAYRKFADKAELFPQSIVLGSSTPEINGSLEPFEYAFEGRGLYDLQGFLSLHEGAYLLSYDSENFYVAVNLSIKKPAEGNPLSTPKVKLFLSPSKESLYELVIEDGGPALIKKNGQLLDIPIRSLSKVEADKLIAEVAIPFTALGFKEAPKDGAQWRLNIGAFFPYGEREVSSAGTLGGLDEYPHFTVLEFNKQSPMLRIADFYHAAENRNATRIEVKRVPKDGAVELYRSSDNTQPYGVLNTKHTLYSDGKERPYAIEGKTHTSQMRSFTLESLDISLSRPELHPQALYQSSFLYRDKVTPMSVSFFYTLERKKFSVSAQKNMEGQLQVRFQNSKKEEIWRKTAPIPNDKRYFETIFDLDLNILKPGDYTVLIDHIANDGVATNVYIQQYRIPDPDSIAFKPYRDPEADLVPAPWSAPAIDKARVKVWGREYDFSTGVLAGQLISQEHAVLSRAIELICNGTPLVPKEDIEWKITRQEATRIELEKQAELEFFTVQTHLIIHFDGYCEVSMTFKPKESAPLLKSLTLDIPIKREYAELFRDGRPFLANSRAGAITTALAMPLTDAPYFWIGNEKAGFNWAARNLKGWHTKDHEKDMEVIPGERETIVRLNLVDSPVRFREGRTIDFAFTLTPTRPLDRGYQRVRYMNEYRLANPWYYFGTPEYETASREIIASRADLSEKIYYYLGFHFSSPFHPDWGFFEQEWRYLRSFEHWGDRTGETPNGQHAYSHSYVSGSLSSPTFRNWASHKYAEFIEKNSAKPLHPKAQHYYFDTGLSVNRSMNPHQEDTSWTDGFGRKFDSFLLNEYRETALNIYRMVKRGNPDSRIEYHQGWYRFAPLQHFTDGLLGGEGVESEVGNSGNNYNVLTPELFRATFSPQIWGVRMSFLDMIVRMFKQSRPEKFARINIWDEELLTPLKHSYGYCLLHDVDIFEDNSETLPLRSVLWRAQDELGWDADTRFFPYWDKEGPIRVRTPKSSRVMASAYLHGEGLMLVVLNDTAEKQEVTVDMDLKTMGTCKGIPGKDIWKPENAVPALDDQWNAEMEPREMRMILWKPTE